MLPEEFLKRMEEMLKEEYPAFLAEYEKEHMHALRVNPLKTDVGGFLRRSPFALKPVPWASAGYYYGSGDAPGKHPYHEAGVYYIQEPSAMAPAEYLMQPFTDAGIAMEEERILDLCAAPGGKSTQIAAAMRGRGLLVSNEIHPARAKILSENMERMGITNALVTNESPQRLAEHSGRSFTRILVDAPCSGEGMFRKNDAACGEWSREQVEACAARQDEILACAASMLLSGGRLVYSTCTFAPQENEGTIQRFLKQHPDFYIEHAEKYEGMSDGVPAWGGEREAEERLSDTIRLWPHRIAGEGHYLAVLRREGSLSDMPGGCFRVQPGIRQREARQPGGGFAGYLAFAAEYLAGSHAAAENPERCLFFGDQLYLMPDQMPRIAGLKVLRPGLHLGTVKKNRFEPSHALAHVLTGSDVRFAKELPSDGDQIRRYLAGEAVACDGPKGWTLVLTDGYSLGWGKVSGGILKNHYPKGLRIV